MIPYDLITILGPTACGKTRLAAKLAHAVGGEIISADSRQVYKGMDIGTGKDLKDYVVDGIPVPYHLIDIAPPGYKYNVYEFQRDFIASYSDIRRRGRIAILCGGSGLYLESVLRSYHLMPVPENPALREQLADKSLAELSEILAGYRPLHNTTDTDTAQRAIRAIEIEEYNRRHPAQARPFPSLRSLTVGIDIDRDTRRRRISERLEARIGEGLVEEVRQLLATGLTPDDLIYYGLEYKYATLYVTGAISTEAMLSQLEIAIHQFAKRQMTWFRGMERRGVSIRWIDYAATEEQKIGQIMRWWGDGDTETAGKRKGNYDTTI